MFYISEIKKLYEAVKADSRESACKILMDDGFINRWNDNHIANIYKLIFETEEE